MTAMLLGTSLRPGGVLPRDYCDLDGTSTQRHMAYLRARAAGGAALVFTEAAYVRADGRGQVRESGVHGATTCCPAAHARRCRGRVAQGGAEPRNSRGQGHLAHPLTLTGLSERSHLLHGGVSLDTHIEDVTVLLAAESIHDAVPVGHGCGGMVITGAADRMPERADCLVYLDAFVPANGDSCWALGLRPGTPLVLRRRGQRPRHTSLPFFDPRATPHPLASLLQPLCLVLQGCFLSAAARPP